MGHQHPEALEAVQRDQTGDAGVFGIVLLLGRAPPAGHQVGVDRHHHVAGVQQALDQHPVAGLEHHPHLGGVELDRGDASNECVDARWRVLHPGDVEHPLARAAQRHQVELLGPVDSYSKHVCSFARRTRTAEAQHRADGPVLVGRHPCWRHQASETFHRGRSLLVRDLPYPQALPGHATLPTSSITTRSAWTIDVPRWWIYGAKVGCRGTRTTERRRACEPACSQGFVEILTRFDRHGEQVTCTLQPRVP